MTKKLSDIRASVTDDYKLASEKANTAGPSFLTKKEKYRGSLIVRLNSQDKDVTKAECDAFFKMQFKIVIRDEIDRKFNQDYFDYVMKLLIYAGRKGFNTTSLPADYRRFAAKHGYGF